MLAGMWPFRRHAAYDVRSSQAWWLLRNGIGDAAPALETSIDCDIAIIGAGITGALIADALVATGRRVVVLDRYEPALASTAASTALLQYEIDTHLVDLMEMLDAERATVAYRACAQSFQLLEHRFPELLAQSDYHRCESVYLAADEKAVARLQAEFAARRAIGMSVEWLDSDELRRRYGCLRPGAIVSALAASFDPVRFTRGVLSACARHGVGIFARTAITGIEEQPDGLRLRTANGHTVTARHVVVAAGYESLDFLSGEIADIDNTFALVTEPLADAKLARSLPQIWESARPYLYLRGTPDGRIMLGGADLPFRSPVAREALLPRQVRRLAAAYEQLFRRELPPIAFTWAGSFAKTRDGLPYIGRMPGKNPRLQFALCFGGNGITYAVHAGEMIRAGMEGGTHPLAAVFGAGRGGGGAAALPRVSGGLMLATGSRCPLRAGGQPGGQFPGIWRTRAGRPRFRLTADILNGQMAAIGANLIVSSPLAGQ
jgi:glycine/D-amino acid oxidase-like deaminating enzyme